MERLNKILILKIGITLIFLIGIVFGGIILYKNSSILVGNKFTNNNFFNATSGVFYRSIWQSKYEKIFLEQELALSNIKKEQAEIWANEESIARTEAEEETQQEIVKKNQAEARAKQEEFERKLKEQELADNEAEEKRMSADNDNDGLTYREEQNLGSSDWSNDSDGDGIQDGSDPHPAGGDRLIAQHFEWDYDGTHWTWDYSFPSDWYDYYRNKYHGDHGIEYVTSDNKYIIDIANMLKDEATKKGYSKSEFAVSFIQSLGYVSDTVIGYDDFPKYPLETMAEQNGDCEDSSYLAAAIIDAMNIDNVLVELPGHMAIAVAFSGSPDGYYYTLSNGRNYYYIETTGEGWMAGEMPSEYIYSNATIVRLSDGSTNIVRANYNKPCDISTEFPGYYYSDGRYFQDSSCRNLAFCLSYEGFYYKPSTESFYWDSSCGQIIVKGCIKSVSEPGYFTNDSGYYYHDSRCTSKARVCTYAKDGYYFDGDDLYWNSSCTQKVKYGCDKSIYHPGYFFDGWDYYSDYNCIYQVNLY